MWFNSMLREEPYLGLTSSDSRRDTVSPSGAERQVLHGCRQLVSWDVGLSPLTSATLIPSCHHSVGHSMETAGVKPEEGGDDVKSSWPLYPGRHTCYNGWYRGLPTREGELISKIRPQFRLKSAIRLHEAGIASNGRSARCREYVPGPCTHRPSSDESPEYPKSYVGRPKVKRVIGAKS